MRGFASAAGVDFGLPVLPSQVESAPSPVLNLIETHSFSASDDSSSSSDSTPGVSSPERAKKKRKSKASSPGRKKRHSKPKKRHASRNKHERIPTSVPGLYEVDTVPDADSLRYEALSNFRPCLLCFIQIASEFLIDLIFPRSCMWHVWSRLCELVCGCDFLQIWLGVYKRFSPLLETSDFRFESDCVACAALARTWMVLCTTRAPRVSRYGIQLVLLTSPQWSVNG